MSNTYSWKSWDVPVITTPLELRNIIEESNIAGKVIKSMKFVSYIADFFEDEEIDDYELERSVEIDSPFIFKFTDGSTFALDFSDFSAVKCGLNSLPFYIKNDGRSCDLNADVIFSDLIGGRICDVGIEDTCRFNSCEHTGSYGFKLDQNQDQYIGKITFYINQNKNIYRLVFYPSWDWGEVYETLYDKKQTIKYKDYKTGIIKDYEKIIDWFEPYSESKDYEFILDKIFKIMRLNQDADFNYFKELLDYEYHHGTDKIALALISKEKQLEKNISET